MTYQNIIKFIDDYLKSHGKQDNSKIYVGITKDILNRLFVDHNVPENGHLWAYAPAIDSEHARAVEKYYLERGMKGGGGGGDDSAIYVYCYEIASYTKE